MRIPYLPSPVATHPIQSDETNILTLLASTVAFGILSYASPRTFYATSVSLLGLSIWYFSDTVKKSKKEDVQHIRSIAIQICTVLASAGIVFGFRALSHLWTAAKALKQFELLSTGGHFSASVGLFMAARVYTYLHDRHVELMSTKNWDQMTNYLGFRDQLGVQTFELFISVFFPNIVPSDSNPLLLHQFKTPEEKFVPLERYLSQTSEITDPQWILAIHYFQEQPFWNQETLMPHLVRIIRQQPDQVPNLPHEIKDRVQKAMRHYSQRNSKMELNTYSLEAFLQLKSFPLVGTANWEIFVDAINQITQLGENDRVLYLPTLHQIVSGIPPEQIKQMPQVLQDFLHT